MVNRLVAGMKAKKKSAVSPVPPMDRVPQKRGPDGMDDDRRWKAKQALDTITQAEAHKRDKKLMADVKKVARDNVMSIDAALGGGLRKGGKK